MSTNERREQLRQRLIEVAEGAIDAGGLDAVKARRLADEAGCAVGGIYNVFADLDALILTVNLRTLEALDMAMSPVARRHAGDPVALLEALGFAYLDFALTQTRRWRALFEHRTPENYPIPDWYTARLDGIFRHLRDPIAALFPGRSAEDLGNIAQALFAATHGIVTLGLDAKLESVPATVIRRRISFLIRAAIAGARGEG
jgi:AcrR family transcriptional regulator